MDNNTFRKWIQWKKERARKDLTTGKLMGDMDAAEIAACEESLVWLGKAERIATYGSGEALRRFRKDYERRLARLGPSYLEKYETEGAALK